VRRDGEFWCVLTEKRVGEAIRPVSVTPPSVAPGDPARAGGDAREPVQAEDRDRGELLSPGVHDRPVPGIGLVEGALAYEVTTVLDAPMAADVAGALSRPRLGGRKVAYVVGGLGPDHAVGEAGGLRRRQYCRTSRGQADASELCRRPVGLDLHLPYWHFR
jgi:hypothetical protein